MKILKMKFIAAAFIMLFGLFDADAQQSKKFETRCGWLQNPTPANYSFYDKDDEWIIGVQGGYQVEDFEAPAFKRGQWVNYFDGSYGYGCACFQMKVDYETDYVLEIRKSYARPLAACRKDKALKKKWDFDL